ncbi:flagellar hook-basal body complex protein [Devosia sp.]|jgi:flagellar hook protein FlgE|uniref:flagellar hook-basal body complex protein n=1 Tax=Devosia sp. TaxID=1871048 RepID=UPI0037BF8C5B
MGIYGAMSTAVTGLRAQSFALENISGNIANSQTTGFKRIDTDFKDLIPDAPQKRQTAGSVLAQSRSTNNLQGDVKSASTETFMAINGSGFFVVEPTIGQSDGTALFSGANYYTRRGDFEINKGGYLVNGAGYYLKGLPIDPQTQNISGSVPQVLKISTAFLPAQQTTRIDYQLNLPQFPKTRAYEDSQTAGSELLNAADFTNVTPTLVADTAATVSGATTTAGANSTTIASNLDTLQIQVGAANRTYAFTNAGGTAGLSIDLNSTTTVGAVLSHIQADLLANGAPVGTTVALSGGAIRITAGNITSSITVVDNTTGSTATGFDLANATTAPTVSASQRLSARVTSIPANESDEFVRQSISGGAISVYSANGAPANVQMRWAKVNSTANGGAEVWNMFVATNAQATGTQTMWTRYGGNYTFGTNGSPSPAVDHTDIAGLTVNGVVIGDVRLQHGTGGLTQFADPNGTAEVALVQNGYPAGKYVSVGVNDAGRVAVSYDNGETVEVAQVVTANFNAVNQLKREDGGVYAATSDSGEPVLDNGGGISGSSLESSNTDISEEFTKLIVTQQAYAAGTRIMSTADQMLQEALNMLR